jgi:hypothetical protein
LRCATSPFRLVDRALLGTIVSGCSDLDLGGQVRTAVMAGSNFLRDAGVRDSLVGAHRRLAAG